MKYRKNRPLTPLSAAMHRPKGFLCHPRSSTNSRRLRRSPRPSAIECAKQSSEPTPNSPNARCCSSPTMKSSEWISSAKATPRWSADSSKATSDISTLLSKPPPTGSGSTRTTSRVTHRVLHSGHDESPAARLPVAPAGAAGLSHWLILVISPTDIPVLLKCLYTLYLHIFRNLGTDIAIMPLFSLISGNSLVPCIIPLNKPVVCSILLEPLVLRRFTKTVERTAACRNIKGEARLVLTVSWAGTICVSTGGAADRNPTIVR